MSITVYSLERNKDTADFHLFEGVVSGKKNLYSPKSVCGKMIRRYTIETIFTDENEDRAREKCAAIGRKVCGTCVSHLYGSD